MDQRPPSSLERLHAVVPLRSLSGGKARLGDSVDGEEREELLLGMLRRTLQLLGQWPAVARVHVVSTDPRVLLTGESCGAHAVAQDAGGLNEGLVLGRTAAAAQGATAVLILPADLPVLESTSLDRLLQAADAAIAAGSGRPLVVVAPSDARGGTNALLLSPVDVIEPRFGAASFEAHIRAAAAADATVQVVTDAGLGFDLDTPEDLEMLPSTVVAELLELGRSAVAASGI